jgi:hypothetical protein
MTRKKFIVEVPCTVVDRYFIFAESEDDAREKMASGSMSEQTREKLGDYILDATADHEPETHWSRAVIVGEDTAVDRCNVCDAVIESKAAFFGFCSEKCLRESNINPKPPVKFTAIEASV